MPRIITADDWAGLSAGLTQRVRALEAFLRDVYGARQIIADGVVPAVGHRRRARLEPAGQAHARGRGADRGGGHRPRARPGRPLARARGQPAGALRHRLRDHVAAADPQRHARPGAARGRRRAGGGAAACCGGALLVGDRTRTEPGHDEVALLSAGPVDSAFYEHQLLADRMGVPVVTPRDLQVTDDGVFLVGEGGRRRLSALYRRIDERALLTAKGADLRPIGRAMCNAAAPRAGRAAQRDGQRRGGRQGRLRLRPGDDHLLPGRGAAAGRTCPPTRASTPTAAPRCWTGSTSSCSSRSTATAARASSSARTRAARSWPSWRRRSGRRPAAWVAQDLVGALDATRRSPASKLEPRAVDLRAFVLQSRRGAGADVRRAARRAEPGRARGQPDRQLLARRRRQGHLGAQVARGRCPVRTPPPLHATSVRG